MDILEKQKEIVDEFLDMEDWEERYHHIIDVGNSIDLDPKYCVPEIKVSGCASQVWLRAEYKDGKLFFTGKSDSLFVQGLLAFLIDVYSNASPQDILDSSPEFLKKAGISEHLSPTRVNGLGSMVQYIRNYAKQYSEVD